MTKSVIFHHPGPLASEPRSGSQVRPVRMLEAMRGLGYEVENVSGSGSKRAQHIRRLVGEIRQGRNFDFVYSESRSIPTLLAEKNRLPFWPVYDLWFLKVLKGAKIPIGLYYRDVFWRFPRYRTMMPFPGRVITKPLYQFDWWWYCRYVDHLFLPSEGMAAHLPSDWPEDRVSGLPPGAPYMPDGALGVGENSQTEPETLHLLYIGGVNPPGYDISDILALAGSNPRTRLTVCCREAEWCRASEYYARFLDSERVEIVHRSGQDALKLYESADVFCILWPRDEYLDFAVPVKLFEAVGHAKPVITYSGTETARIVERESVGWVVRDGAELSALIDRLIDQPTTISTMQKQVVVSAKRNGWMERVREVARCLSGVCLDD